jgi:2-deoxy-D-gluconate 3-dehydrogenase
MIDDLRPVFHLFDLTDRTAIITGGAGLLGSRFCLTLAQAGAKVVVADRNIETANSVAQQINLAGNQALAIQTDITDIASTANLVSNTLLWTGRLDILVNCAALDPKFDPFSLGQDQAGPSGEFETFPLEAWNSALEVNLTGAFLCCQAVSKPMLAQGSGVIINIASMYGMVGPDQRLYGKPDQPPSYKPVYYTVTKAGILGLTRYLATYYSGKNIRVNALTPGGVFNGHDEVFLQAYSARSVLGRMADKDEMNGALLFLASDASSYMTGANLVVDGGWTAW